MSATIFVIGRILLGGAFIVFGIRNLKNIERLSGVLARKNIPQPRTWILVGIGIQLAAGSRLRPASSRPGAPRR